jgi:hypothetical protein
VNYFGLKSFCLKNFSTLLLLLVFFNGVCAQAVRRPVSSRYMGMGAYSLNHVDVFSATANQASLAQIKTAAAGVYGERRFMVDATNMYSAIVALPTSKGNFAVQADYFGYKNYNESQIGLAYARSLGTKVDVGVKFNYYNVQIPGYGNGSNVNFEIGTILHLTDKVHAGLHAYNPVGGKISKNGEEELGGIYTFGIGYEPSESFLVTVDVSKEEDLPVNITPAIQYNFKKQFFTRLGVETETGNFFGGAGVSWKLLRLDLNASYHPQLGFSPAFALIVHFKEKRD